MTDVELIELVKGVVKEAVPAAIAAAMPQPVPSNLPQAPAVEPRTMPVVSQPAPRQQKSPRQQASQNGELKWDAAKSKWVLEFDHPRNWVTTSRGTGKMARDLVSAAVPSSTPGQQYVVFFGIYHGQPPKAK